MHNAKIILNCVASASLVLSKRNNRYHYLFTRSNSFFVFIFPLIICSLFLSQPSGWGSDCDCHLCYVLMRCPANYKPLFAPK